MQNPIFLLLLVSKKEKYILCVAREKKLLNKCCNAMYALNNQSLLLFLQSGILAAKSAPSFVMELKDQRAAVGESAKFTCKFAGTPRPGRYNYNHPPH